MNRFQLFVLLTICGCSHEMAVQAPITIKSEPEELALSPSLSEQLESSVGNTRLSPTERYRALRQLENVNRKRSISIAHDQVAREYRGASQGSLMLSHNALALLARAERDGFLSAKQALGDLSENKEVEQLLRLLRKSHATKE